MISLLLGSLVLLSITKQEGLISLEVKKQKKKIPPILKLQIVTQELSKKKNIDWRHAFN